MPLDQISANLHPLKPDAGVRFLHFPLLATLGRYIQLSMIEINQSTFTIQVAHKF